MGPNRVATPVDHRPLIKQMGRVQSPGAESLANLGRLLVGPLRDRVKRVYVSDRAILATLFDVDLAEVCITSNYEVREDEAPSGAFRLDGVPGVGVVVERAVGTKCARSWKILPTVGEDAEYPDVSPRDAAALREWKALGVAV